MTDCDLVQQWLVDEASPRPPGLEQHLAGCPACQGVRAAHASALRLEGHSPVPARRVPLARVRQRAAALGALALVAVGVGGLWRLQGPVASPARELSAAPGPRGARPPLEGELAAREAEAASLDALVALGLEVSRAARRNPAVHDAAYRAFGPLPAWVALETPPPARALGRASSPLVSSPED